MLTFLVPSNIELIAGFKVEKRALISLHFSKQQYVWNRE